ncbi:MAG TPA: hypothetical protein VI076_15735 [Actinopolymorphaceae bacterium]
MTTDAPPTRHRRETRSGGLWWGTAFTLGPYALAMVVVMIIAWPQTEPAGSAACTGLGFGCTPAPRDLALMLLVMSAPFAVLATGLTWVIVLLLRRGRAGAWPPPAQGGTAAALIYVLAGLVIASQLGPGAADAVGFLTRR